MRRHPPSSISKTRPEDLRDRILEHFAILRVALRPEDLDAALARAEREGQSHLEFLETVIAAQGNARRQRAIERRIREAQFHEQKTLEEFDWEFNKNSIDRVQMEELGTADFIRRRENIVVIGRSGVGKSHLMQAMGRKACEAGYRVRYTTSALLLDDLTASLADKTLPKRLRYYARFDLLIVDAFGFDKIERAECPEAASLLYKVIDSRCQKSATILITNVAFDEWATYLGDAPLAMALLDRVVDGAIIIRIPDDAKSYRAHRRKLLRKSAKQDLESHENEVP